MRICLYAASCAVALLFGTSHPASLARADARAKMRLQAPAEAADSGERTALKPEIAVCLKKATDAYLAMKSYRHNSEYLIKGQTSEGDTNSTQVYTLALERPNKFLYKSDASNGSVALCNGKTFINHRIDHTPDEREHTYYTKITAPATFKGINIVDDVTFTYGTYLIALMLQGDVLADKEVRTGMEQATLQSGVMENGKKYDILSVPFQEHVEPYDTNSIRFYFDANTHLLQKTVEEVMDKDTPTHVRYRVLEIIENVSINKPLPPATFEYKLPKNARHVVGLPVRASGRIAAIRMIPAGQPRGSRLRTGFTLGPSF